MERVVITGIGAVTPLGLSISSSWEAVVTGVSGIRPVSRFNASGLPWTMAGELQGFEPTRFLTPKEGMRLDPFIHYAVAAAVMAVTDSGLPGNKSGDETGKTNRALGRTDPYLASGGVVIGSSRGGISSMERAFATAGKPGSGDKRPHVSAYLMPATTISMAASMVAQKFGMQGHCLGISNACASGANAIGEAFRLLKAGYGGPILAGGAEAPVCRFCMAGYGASGALSKRRGPDACRPFDKSRDGFVLAEGASVLVLERQSEALKRGANIYCEIVGYGNTSDAYHQTKPSSAGEAGAIRMALLEAGISAGDIDYINAHAPSTLLGDQAEAEAIQEVFGKTTAIPVSATKSMTGHMLAASGALEAAVTAMSISRGIITPTAHLKESSADCSFNHVRETRTAEISTAISNSFGFGGVNAVLAFKKYTG